MFGHLLLSIVLFLQFRYNITAPHVRDRSHPRATEPSPQFLSDSKSAITGGRRNESKRGMDIGLRLKIPTEKPPANLETVEKGLVKALKKELVGVTGETELEKLLDLKEKTPEKLLLKPAFECDAWDGKTRTCWLDRNTGDTVTFSLSTGMMDKRRSKPDVIWKKEFARKGTDVKEEYVIDPNKLSRNMVIGKRGYELRISPVTELDVDDNQFSASFLNDGGTRHSKVNFRIRIMPEDLGFVYVGETIHLSIESYVGLPLGSMTFHWYTEKDGESSTLPSNMKVSTSGATLVISELRQEQEGIVACSIYTNKDIHATKKRFLLKDLSSNKEVLKDFADHNITFPDEKRKRKNKGTEIRMIRASGINPTHKQKTTTRAITTPKKSSKTGREVLQADVEGEQYTMIKPDKDSSSRANSGQDPLNDNKYALNSPEGSLETENQIPNTLNLGFTNSTDQDTVVNIDVRNRENMEDDKISQLICSCVRDIECSKHATCVRRSLKERGFCRCLTGFYGPGIFCREDM